MPLGRHRPLHLGRMTAPSSPKEQPVPALPQGKGLRLPSPCSDLQVWGDRDTWERSPGVTLGQVSIPPYLRCIR